MSLSFQKLYCQLHFSNCGSDASFFRSTAVLVFRTQLSVLLGTLYVSSMNLLKTELLQTIGCLSSTQQVLMFLLAYVDRLKGKTIFKMTQMFQKSGSEMMF